MGPVTPKATKPEPAAASAILCKADPSLAPAIFRGPLALSQFRPHHEFINSKASLWARILFVTLAAFVGTELPTGSTPVPGLLRAMFTPALYVVILFYSLGVLLCRELAIIYKKGWLSILFFGLAYGVVEEGIFAKTWFADIPISYGKWIGVNWSFGFAEIIVESIFSILIPIALSRIVFKGSKNERWFRRNGLVLEAILFLLVVLLGFKASFVQYTNPGMQIPLAVLMIAGFSAIGYFLPSSKGQSVSNCSPINFYFMCFLLTAFIFVVEPVWLTPGTVHLLPPVIADVIGLGTAIGMAWFLQRQQRSARQLFAAVLGMTSVMVLWSIFGPQRSLGAPIGSAIYLLLILFAWRKLKQQPVVS
jgi:hypothetical protein